MNYFSRRNDHLVEYSGYEEVSESFRNRLIDTFSKYVAKNVENYSDDLPWYVEVRTFSHQVRQEFPGENYYTILQTGEFHKVFSVIEMFLDHVPKIYRTRRDAAFFEILQSFRLSGSVYEINGNRVELVVAEELAKKIQDVKRVLANDMSASNSFFQAVGNLFGRKAKSEDIIKDIFVAFEDYLKEKTQKNEYGNAVSHLEKQNVISTTQRALLEKIYAYRSDTYGVGHAGNAAKPGETDALWFLETTTAQLLYIDRKLKQSHA